jgi:hypothetical protein
MKPNKDILKDAILLAVESLRKDICQDANPDNNLTRAQAIKKLTEAYFMASKA